MPISKLLTKYDAEGIYKHSLLSLLFYTSLVNQNLLTIDLSSKEIDVRTVRHTGHWHNSAQMNPNSNAMS